MRFMCLAFRLSFHRLGRSRDVGGIGAAGLSRRRLTCENHRRLLDDLRRELSL